MQPKNQNRFFIVDVFGEEKYSGNQLAVVEVKFPISDIEMQKIAAEFNFPETTFITSLSEINNGFNVRIFTPRTEVPFAGHPTLGTAYIIRREIIKESVDHLNLKIGQIPVRFVSENNRVTLWMKQINPNFGKICENIGEACAMVGLSTEDIDVRFPIQVVSTGIPFLIFPVKSLAAIKRAGVNHELYRQYFIG